MVYNDSILLLLTQFMSYQLNKLNLKKTIYFSGYSIKDCLTAMHAYVGKLCFKKRTLTITGNTTDYLEPISNTNANYRELSPNNIYHELNSNTNYQELKIQYVEINQFQSTTL